MERSFGIIPLRQNQAVWETLIVQHHQGHWAFPKGHPESSETEKQTAERELQEETNLQVESYFDFPPIEESYSFQREGEQFEKKVTYFMAEVSGNLNFAQPEIINAKWVKLEEAASWITFAEGQKIAAEAKLRLLEGLS